MELIETQERSSDDLDLKSTVEKMKQEIFQLQLLVQQLTVAGHLGIKALDSAKGSPVTPTWRRFPALMSLVFVVGCVVLMPILIAQTVLIAIGSDTYKTIGFAVFNFLLVNWAVFSANFCTSWAGSTRVVRISFVLTIVVFAFEAVWVYNYFGQIAAVPLIAGCFLYVFNLPNAEFIYLLMASQPYNSSFETWLNSFRFFILAALPVVATYIRNGTATAISYYAVLIFTAAMCVFCCNIRFDFNKHPDAKSIGNVLYKINLHRFVSVYIPVLGMMLTFVCLYVVTTAGLDRTGADLTSLMIACAVAFTIFLVWFATFGPVVDFVPRTWYIHKFSSITPEQYDRLLHNTGRDHNSIAPLI